MQPIVDKESWLNMSIGERIIELRKLEHISQADLAKALSVSRQAVSKWERGICCPDIALLDEIADLFGMSIDMFVRMGKPHG